MGIFKNLLTKKLLKKRFNRFTIADKNIEFDEDRKHRFTIADKHLDWADEVDVNNKKDNIMESFLKDNKNQIEEWENHNKTLSDDHKSHIEVYKTHSYINEKIYNRRKTNKSDEDHIENLDHVTNVKIKHPVTVYRGFDTNYNDIKKYKVGRVFSHKGYTSTTLNYNIAKNFTNEDDGDKVKPTLFKINLKKNDRGHYIDLSSFTNNNEHEVLLPRNQKFKVIAHSEDKDHKYIHLDTHK